MTSARTWLCNLYYAIALIALIGTWRQNHAFMAENKLSFAQTFVDFWPALLANRATISITVDIFLFVLAACVWMVLEARRLGVSFVWLYIFFAITIAISVTFPLFLAARERRLAALGSTETEPKAGVADVIGLAALALLSVGFMVYCTLR